MKRHRLAAIAAPAALLAACAGDVASLGSASGSAAGTGGASASVAATGGAPTAGTGGGASLGVLDCAPCPGDGCAVTAVASGQDAAGATGLAVTDEGVYWTNLLAGTVMRLPASGGAPAVLAKALAPRVIAVSDGYAVWIGQGIYGCTVSACQATLKLLLEVATGDFTTLAYDGQDVYYSGSAGSFCGSVSACAPMSGCAGGTMLASCTIANGIAIQGSHVFWTEGGNVDVSPKTGGGYTTVASALNLPTGVAADDTYVYWTEADPSAGKVRRCPYPPGDCTTPEDLATGLATPGDVALAGGRVYWLDQGDGKVLSCPVAGCGGAAPRVHASARPGLQHLALGASCVFWTDDEGGGSVSKAAP